MDVATLRLLSAASRPRVFVGLGNAAYLEKQDVPLSRDLDCGSPRRSRPA